MNTRTVQQATKSAAPTTAQATQGVLQRKCACGTHTMGGYACAECSGKKGLLQRKAAGHESVSEVPPIVHEVLRSPGQPLDPATRAFFEPRFGYDFSQVRMHTDTQASESAQAVSALAYTVGQDVVFGHYAPSTNMGRQLLAHELSHVIQQTGHDRAASIKQDFPLSQALVSPTHLRPLPVRVGANSDAAEQEADRMANQVMQQSRPSIGPTAFMGMHNFTPVLRRQGNIPEPKPDAREIMLRQLATRPQLVLQRWKSLSPSEQDQVLWNMIRLYGPPFTTEFQQYAKGLKKPRFSGGALKGFEYTPKWLFDRGYRHAYGELWVHPSGEEITFLGPRKTESGQPPPIEPPEEDREKRCSNNCLEDTQDEDECRICCETKFPDRDSECRRYCDARCDNKL